ncbi:heparinase II/III family protein [bacterium]|nr:heparinase II/III family protein [bacterium]
MPTTRTWQSAWLAAILALSLFATGVFAAAPAHPHLYFTSSDISGLRSRTANSFYAENYTRILMSCRSSFGPQNPVPNPTRANNARGLVSHAALLLLDPNGLAIDARYQSNTMFFSYFNTCLNWSGWSDFFGGTSLDTSLFLIALCTGYDWHYDKFTSSQRADIVSKLATRADYIANDTGGFFEDVSKIGGSSGYLYVNDILRNKTMIPVGALGMIAYTLEGEVDETRRQKWLAKVDEMLGIWDDWVAHDGTSHEGYSYHEYMARCLMPMLYARSRRTGVNQFKLYSNIKNYPLYSIYAWVPGGDRSFVQPIPFGDCDTEPPAPLPTHTALVARMLKGDSGKFDQLANWMEFKATGSPANNAYYRVEPTQFFWADSSIAVKSPQELGLPRFHYFKDSGTFVWRSGWDNMATYFAMMAGPTIGGHQHPEMGDFVIHKGGAPFIADHGYSKSRRTEDNNLVMINGTGEYGDRWDDGNGNTEPQPSSKWASIARLVADDDYFDVVANLKPIYRASLSGYTREFVQASGVIFVFDKIKMSSGTGKFESILNAYSTVQPAVTDSYNALDIDSNPTANPWGGSGRTHTVTPRAGGPFTGSLTVQDLSKSSWTPTVKESIVNNRDNDFARRGNRLVLTQTASSGNLLVAFYFPASGKTLSAWPDSSAGNGFVIKSGTTVQALGLWSDTGSVSNSSGLTMSGQMGGLDLAGNAFWSRQVTSLKYNNRTYLTSNNPVSVYCAQTSSGSRMRIQSDASATVSVYHPVKPATVKLNGSTLATSSWSWSGGMLKLTIPAQSSQGLVETALPPRNAANPGAWAVYF